MFWPIYKPANFFDVPFVVSGFVAWSSKSSSPHTQNKENENVHQVILKVNYHPIYDVDLVEYFQNFISNFVQFVSFFQSLQIYTLTCKLFDGPFVFSGLVVWSSIKFQTHTEWWTWKYHIEQSSNVNLVEYFPNRCKSCPIFWIHIVLFFQSWSLPSSSSSCSCSLTMNHHLQLQGVEVWKTYIGLVNPSQHWSS